MNLSTAYDWKKKAAQQVVDKDTVERSFMDQAYGFLANKAGKLMQDPYRLGFEVVFKNDSNTRMVGIFAFRVNDQILYAPVFFLNGEIKGTDLLYRQETKTFVPLNEEWVTFLTEKSNYDPGIPIDKKNFTRTNNNIRFEDITNPPNNKKSASEIGIWDKENFVGSPLYAIFESSADVSLRDLEQSNDKEAGEFLRKFLVEDGGEPAIEKMANWMEGSFDFTEALVVNIKEQYYLPEGIKKTEKKAAAPNPRLVLFTGAPGATPHTPLLKEAKQEYVDRLFSKGYYLWDDRAPSDITPVYKDNTELMEMVGNAGLYDVLLSDGSFRKAIVAPTAPVSFSEDSNGGMFNASVAPSPYNLGQSPASDHTVCCTEGDKSIVISNKVYGKFIKDLAQMIKDEDLKTKASSGNAYCVLDTGSGCLSRPIYIKSVKTVDGLHVYTAVKEYGGYDTVEIRHNPDVRESDLAANFLGSSSYFVPIGTDTFKTEAPSASGTRSYYHFRPSYMSSPMLGTADALDSWVLEHVKKASLMYDDETSCFSWRNGYRDQTPYIPRVNMAVKLASVEGISAKAVESMLDTAQKLGTSSWYYGDPELTKSAFTRRVNDSANFRTTSDGEFGVDREDAQSFVIDTQQDEMEVPKQHIGDAYDPAMGRKPEEGMSKDQLMSMSPEAIAQFATSNKLPNVFEHGVVGSMVQVYDSLSMIDKYLPELEAAQDRLGRILFLFYWKPRDFEDAYGSDDMTNLENQIMSNFKSFGALVLDLMRRSKKRKLGNVSLGS